MIYTNLNYYSHLLLNSKYSFIIKLALIFFIYSLFYLDNTNDIAYCAKEQYKIFVKKIENLEYLIQEFEFIYFAKDPFTKVVDKTCLSQLCLEILHELEQTCLMLKKSEDLFINSLIVAKCYKLIKVNQAIFSKIKPYLNIKVD